MDEMKKQDGWETAPAAGRERGQEKPVGEDTLNDILAAIGGGQSGTAGQIRRPADPAASTVEVDDRFRDFFTNTVAVIPENALAGGTAAAPEEEEEPPRKGFFGWLTSLFRHGEPEEPDEDAGEVLVPGRAAPAQAEEEFDAPLQPVEPEDNTTQIDLHLVQETPEKAAVPGDLTGEIRLDEADAVPAGEAAPRREAAEASGAGKIRFMEAGAKPRKNRKRVRAVPPQPAADETAAAAQPKPEPEQVEEHALTDVGDVDIAELLAVQGGVPADRPASAPPQGRQAEQAPSRSDGEERPAPAAKPSVPPVLPEEPEEPEPDATPEKRLSFEDIDIDAILAEGAQKAAKEKENGEEAAAAVREGPEAPAADTGFDTPLPSAPEPAPPAPAGGEPAIVPETGGAPPAQAEEPQPAEPDEPTGEIRLEPVEPGAEHAPEHPGRAEEEPAEITAAEPEPAPSAEEKAQEGGQLLTGEIPLNEETEGPPVRIAGETPAKERTQKVHTAAIRLFGNDEETEPEEPEEEPEPESEPAAAPAEYEDPADADTVAQNLRAAKMRLALRAALTGILGAALLVLGLMGQGVLAPGAALDPETAPAAFIGVNLILLLAACGISRHILWDGLRGLVGKPSPDTLPALAAVAAVLQLAACLAAGEAFDPLKTTLFSSAAVLLLFTDTLGSWLMASVVQGNFDLVSAGVEHSAAYRLKDRTLAATLAAGMEEENPALLLNRPAALMKGFLAQSFSPRRSDKTARKLARILLAAAAVGAVVTVLRGGGVLYGITAFAGVLCLGAPLSATLVSAVPSLLMQRSASRVGAVIPGWYNIAQLGEVDMVQVDAKELFTPACAQLFGIKTFQKERIDLAILYATSILIKGCNTLEGLFRGMIENKTEMLYEVKDLETKPGLGFTAWCDNCRVVLGTRAMMALEEIPLPALDYEERYSKEGRRHVLYLAVSGKLYAMFLLGYTGERSVARSMATLRRENIRLLVTADDPTLTAERIEDAYHLERGFVKVLSAEERKALEPATLYLPSAEGCMVHLGSFASFVGGLKAAAGADEGERSACAVQTVSVLFSVAVGLLLSFTGGLTGVSLLAVLLYQIAWSALSVAITLTKKY